MRSMINQSCVIDDNVSGSDVKGSTSKSDVAPSMRASISHEIKGGLLLLLSSSTA